MEEIWEPIIGYEGLYEISTFGKVKSLSRQRIGKGGFLRYVPECILKQRSSPSGYFQVCLFKNSVRWYPLVHRLLGFAFLPNPNNLPQINHINGNKLDNSLYNLEWISQSENQKHAYRIGLQPYQYGSNRPCSKLSENEVINIKKLINQGLRLKKIADLYKVNPVTISDIKNNKTWVRTI